jgi:hypothetical protein
MSAPKSRVPSRRKPRKGAKPSPWRRAVSTAARQSTPTIISFGGMRQRLGPAVKTTGVFLSDS